MYALSISGWLPAAMRLSSFPKLLCDLVLSFLFHSFVCFSLFTVVLSAQGIFRFDNCFFCWRVFIDDMI